MPLMSSLDGVVPFIAAYVGYAIVRIDDCTSLESEA